MSMCLDLRPGTAALTGCGVRAARPGCTRRGLPLRRSGVTGGRPDGTYDPDGTVQRDQMGGFLARTLDLFVDNGGTGGRS